MAGINGSSHELGRALGLPKKLVAVPVSEVHSRAKRVPTKETAGVMGGSDHWMTAAAP